VEDGRFPAPAVAALVAACLVFLGYVAIIGFLVARGSELDPGHVLVQVLLQTVGVATLAAAVTWLVRKLW